MSIGGMLKEWGYVDWSSMREPVFSPRACDCDPRPLQHIANDPEVSVKAECAWESVP